jgi:hypothetical protein
MKIAVYFLLACSALWAQSSGSAPRATGPASAPQATAPVVSGSPVVSPQEAQILAELLRQVSASADKSNADVARVRIDKWKADAASKQQAQAGAESIRRNLANAVPDLVQRIQSSPGSLVANFRLYRNLNALYDTFSALAESAGAFGAREQYEPLAEDVSQLDHLRHQMAERVDLLAGTNDAELGRLRTQLATIKPAAKPVAKIVVDNDQPKTKKKSKTTQPQSQSPAK